MLKKGNKCCIGDCDAVMQSFEEVATGVCSFHRDFLTRSGFFIGICWNCNRITGVYEVNRRLRSVWTARYLFSKGCSHCSKDPNAEIAWITIDKHESNARWAISGDGRLVREENKQVENKA